VAGELFLGGVQVGRGYLEQPRETAARFMPDPFARQAGARWYRTGDRVRWRSDGQLEFLGRIDQQVKLRGQRIELGEIETALRQQPGVVEAAAVVRTATSGQPQLIAYVATDGDVDVPSREALRRVLPDYMVPAAIVRLPELPRTPSGKLDRRSLPAPEAATEHEWMAPRTPTEQRLAAIWAQLLQRERIGLDDNFFALGGDSILSIAVVARAREAGLEVTTRQLFEYQTIRALATVIVPVAPAASAATGAEAVNGPVPLTPIQSWFFARRLRRPSHYNQAVLLTLPPTVAVPRLLAAIAAVTRQHAAFGLRFGVDAGEWRQRQTPARDLPASWLDLARVPAEQRGPLIERIAAWVQRSLDVTDGPIGRAVAMVGDRDAAGRLLFVVHHLIVDGVSWRILLADVQRAYRAGGPVSWPPASWPFATWATALMTDGVASAVPERAHWEQVLRTPVPPLPRDRATGENTAGSTDTIRMRLDTAATRQLLQETGAAAQAELPELLLTALVAAVHAWSGATRLRVAMEGHGREAILPGADLTRTVGWFTSLFPIVLEHPLDGRSPLAAVQAAWRAVPRRGIGFGLSALDASDTAEISFNYLGQFDQTLDSHDDLFQSAPESVGPSQHDDERRAFLLDVTAIVLDGCLSIDWIYSRHVHRRDTIERVAQEFLDALQRLIAQPVPAAALLLSAHELQDVLAELNLDLPS
jgi:non-ribosomal peptide synthase protein (TIGR01720 family)